MLVVEPGRDPIEDDYFGIVAALRALEAVTEVLNTGEREPRGSECVVRDEVQIDLSSMRTVVLTMAGGEERLLIGHDDTAGGLHPPEIHYHNQLLCYRTELYQQYWRLCNL